jgi:acyl carrier protein
MGSIGLAFKPIDWNSASGRKESKRRVNTEFVPPRTPVEEVVAAIWAESLKMPRVGIRDNFFDLGGDSLTAVQIVSRVCGAIQTEVSLHNLFEAPTVEEFSRIATERESEPGKAGRIAGFIKMLRNQPEQAPERGSDHE